MTTTDIRVCDVSFDYEDHLYRTPLKFGGVAVDRVTLLNVTMTVETATGQRASGFGSMPLGNVWAWPTRTLSYDQTLAEMKAMAPNLAQMVLDSKPGHPIQIGFPIEQRLQAWTAARQAERNLPEPVPYLATLVVASPFDAALHDAYGKVHGLNCYHTYGPSFFDDDLGDYLGDEFRGDKLQSYISKEPQPRMPLYHLVGALDPLTPADVKQPLADGLPETLGDWIRRDGLTHLKVKLNGDDLGWDVARVLAVNAVAQEVQQQRGISAWWYSLDFNERCPNVEYLLSFLEQVEARAPAAYGRIQYVEQPTARDLRANPANRMHAAAKKKPVVIDESLLDLESLLLAREMGYTGVAFKACKGQTQSLLMAAAAQKFGLFRCVQDLTCPGASLIHSAGLAAHIPGVAAIESNSRQFCPGANAPWEARFPGVFTIRDGTMNTGSLTGVGLGAI